FFDRSYKVIPQIGDEDRATVGPLLDLKLKTPGGQLVPVSTFTHIESSTAPRTLNRFQQRNAARVFGGVKPGVTKEEGLRVLETAVAAASGPGVVMDYAGESRQIRREGSALTVTLGFALVLIYLVLAAQFHSFGDPPLVLVTGPGAEARNSIGTVLVAGMTVGTLFTLFVVPVFYSLIAAQHQVSPVHEPLEREARQVEGTARAEWSTSAARGWDER